jgi:hypothetical protein
MTTTVKLTDDFELPAYRTGAEVLFLLANTIDEVFSSPGTIDLLDGSEEGDWIELLSLLGKFNVDPQTKISQSTRIGDLWDGFVRLNDIQKFEKEVIDTLHKARGVSVALATSGTSAFDYLDTANTAGHKIAKKILSKHGSARLLPAAPVSVEVFYDGPGERYCAGSSLWTNQIRWAYQPLPHALSGAVLADVVFAHEYLSHLAPRNKYLSSTIREQWLVAALRQSLEEDKLCPYWKIRIWPRYRHALESHVTGLARILQPDASVVRYSGLQGAEENLRVLSIRYPPLFWRLTKEILESDDDAKLAAEAVRVAKQLAYKGLPDLKRRKINSINSLAAMLDL